MICALKQFQTHHSLHLWGRNSANIILLFSEKITILFKKPLFIYAGAKGTFIN